MVQNSATQTSIENGTTTYATYGLTNSSGYSGTQKWHYGI